MYSPFTKERFMSLKKEARPSRRQLAEACSLGIEKAEALTRVELQAVLDRYAKWSRKQDLIELGREHDRSSVRPCLLDLERRGLKEGIEIILSHFVYQPSPLLATVLAVGRVEVTIVVQDALGREFAIVPRWIMTAVVLPDDFRFRYFKRKLQDFGPSGAENRLAYKRLVKAGATEVITPLGPGRISVLNPRKASATVMVRENRNGYEKVVKHAFGCAEIRLPTLKKN